MLAHIFRIFRFVALPLVFLVPAMPNSLTRAVSGTVTDQNNRPIPHAAVQMENERTLWIRSYITGRRGEFSFANLSPDIDYDLQAQFDGIRSRKKTLSRLDSPDKSPVHLVIRLPH